MKTSESFLLCCTILSLAACKPGTPADATAGTTGGTGATECATDTDCQSVFDAGNCFDAGGTGVCRTCQLDSDCTGLGVHYVCTLQTCVISSVDAGPTTGHCNSSCDCTSAGQTCENTVCAAQPSQCMSDTDCPCGAICQSHVCFLPCGADAGNSQCHNPTPKCYAGLGRCGFCSTTADCPTGESCLSNGSCGTPQVTGSTTAGGTGAVTSSTGGSGISGAPLGGIAGTGGGSALGGLGGLGGIGGSGSGSPLGGLSGGLPSCDPQTCLGCASGQACLCPTLPPASCTPTSGCGGGSPICL